VSQIVDRRTGLVLDTTTADGVSDALILHHQAAEQAAADLQRLAQQLTEGLGALAEQIDAVSGTITDAQTEWCWHGLTGPAAQQLWAELTDWVGWLRGRYPLARQIPPCWWAHPELVEELTALLVAWRGAYRTPDAPATAPADWHDRWLPGFLHRITGQWKIPCTAGQHEDRVDGAFTTKPVDDDEAFAAFAAADVAARQTAPAQAQSPERMAGLLAAGEAQQIGAAPDAPVRYGGGFWRLAGNHWQRVHDENVTAQLAADAQRWRLATGQDPGGDPQ